MTNVSIAYPSFDRQAAEWMLQNDFDTGQLRMNSTDPEPRLAYRAPTDPPGWVWWLTESELKQVNSNRLKRHKAPLELTCEILQANPDTRDPMPDWCAALWLIILLVSGLASINLILYIVKLIGSLK